MTRALVVYCTYLGATEGLWCRDCAASSGVAAHMATRTPVGVPAVSRSVWCVDCQGTNVVPPEQSA